MQPAMRIEPKLFRFCAEKTKEVIQEYEAGCVVPGIDDGFPRSADELAIIMQGRSGKEIFHRQLRVDANKARFRSFYVEFPERFEIYYARGLTKRQLRYYKTKELLQIHLWLEESRTEDIIEHIKNMMILESPDSLDLNLGHATASETLADIAAMEYLFPWSHRLEYAHVAFGGNGIDGLAEKYDIPPFVVQRSFNVMMALEEYFK